MSTVDMAQRLWPAPSGMEWRLEEECLGLFRKDEPDIPVVELYEREGYYPVHNESLCVLGAGYEDVLTKMRELLIDESTMMNFIVGGKP